MGFLEPIRKRTTVSVVRRSVRKSLRVRNLCYIVYTYITYARLKDAGGGKVIYNYSPCDRHQVYSVCHLFIQSGRLDAKQFDELIQTACMLCVWRYLYIEYFSYRRSK